jgi:hypothetical protein
MSEEEEEEDDDDNEKMLMEALRLAEKAFDDYFEKQNIDAVYFNMDLVGYEYGGDFHTPCKIIDIQNHRARVETEKAGEKEIREMEEARDKK